MRTETVTNFCHLLLKNIIIGFKFMTAHKICRILSVEKEKDEKYLYGYIYTPHSVVGCWDISVCVMNRLHAGKQRNHGLIQRTGKRLFYTPSIQTGSGSN
jgi:hypothetical protein